MFYRTYHRIAAVAVMGAVVLTGAAQLARAQAPEKKVKDQGEYDIYNQTLKDMATPANLLKDLDTWAQKYPDSDWKDDRQGYYIRAYNGTNQPAKVLEVGAQLMGRDLHKVFPDPKAGPPEILTILYLMCVNLQKLPNATPEQMAQGEAAAKALAEFVPTFFTAANKPAGTTDVAWNEGKTTMEKVAKDTRMYIATKPGADAMARYTANKDAKECVTAESGYKKALEQYPESALIAYQLGRALRCQQTAGPEKVPQALYEFARASAVDPTLGGTMDAKALNNYLESAYSSYHGSLEGLDQLKTQAKANPLPPADLKIKTATQIAGEKQAEFEQSNPQLALWMRIKGALSDTNGATYFENELKDSEVPPLKGTLLEGKPSCKSKELLVAIPLPDQQGNPVAEITIKLDAPLAGTPETGSTIQFKGVPKAFSKDPFMLTMEAEKAKVENVKTSPCGAAPAKKAAPRKK
ncbi:MAG: hypothetical protein ABI759_30025 [Candidatus Solibacter sp.]